MGFAWPSIQRLYWFRSLFDVYNKGYKTMENETIKSREGFRKTGISSLWRKKSPLLPFRLLRAKGYTVKEKCESFPCSVGLYTTRNVLVYEVYRMTFDKKVTKSIGL